MNFRIIKVSSAGGERTCFVPQQKINGLWQEFFGFDSDSPYLHVRTFPTLEMAKAFLLDPAICKGDHVFP